MRKKTLWISGETLPGRKSSKFQDSALTVQSQKYQGGQCGWNGVAWGRITNVDKKGHRDRVSWKSGKTLMV